MSNEKAVPEIREWRKQWSHPPTPIPVGASGLWYSEDCVDQMLADYSNARIAALKAEIARLSAPLSEAEIDEHFWEQDGIEAWVVGVEGCDRLILARATPPQDAEKIGGGE